MASSVEQIQLEGSNGRYYDVYHAHSSRPPSIAAEVIVLIGFGLIVARVRASRRQAMSLALLWAAARVYSLYCDSHQAGFGWLGNLVIFALQLVRRLSGVAPIQSVQDFSDVRISSHIETVRAVTHSAQSWLPLEPVERTLHRFFDARDGHRCHILLIYPDTKNDRDMAGDATARSVSAIPLEDVPPSLPSPLPLVARPLQPGVPPGTPYRFGRRGAGGAPPGFSLKNFAPPGSGRAPAGSVCGTRVGLLCTRRDHPLDRAGRGGRQGPAGKI